MRLLGKNGIEYVPSTTDRLWLARAVEAEGAPRGDVASTLINGFIWARSERGYAAPLWQWVRSYSQPVNPAWFQHGAEHLKRLNGATETERNRLISLALVRESIHSTRVHFSGDTRAAVEFALSHPPILTEATDFAAPFRADGTEFIRPPPWRPLTPAVRGRNRFWVRPAAIGWAGYRVAELASGLSVLVACAIAVAIWRT